MYESCIKRLLDLILSLAACVVLAIPMGIIALWIKKDSPGPVFFKQRRVGRGKKCFNILKFRTMRGDTPHDVPTHLLKTQTAISPKVGLSCAAPAWMSCRRSITLWQGRCPSSARARRCIISMT